MVPQRLSASGLRRWVIAIAVLALIAVAIAVFRPWKAPEASAQARLAKSDPVWRLGPTADGVDSSYVVPGDAAWVPWANRTTGVGRWYRIGPNDTQTLQSEWTSAAESAGWRQAADPSCQGRLTKELDKWTAVLTIKPDDGGQRFLGVNISFPVGDNRGQPLCTS